VRAAGLDHGLPWRQPSAKRLRKQLVGPLESKAPRPARAATASVNMGRGPDNRMMSDEFMSKLVDCPKTILPEADARAFITRVLKIETETSVRDLLKSLGRAETRRSRLSETVAVS
jgi:hypothetical protein